MAQGDGIPLHMAIDMTRACTPFRTHTRSLAPLSSTRFPAHIFFHSAILFLVYFGSVWRLAFFFFFPQCRMDSTVQAFSSHLPNFYFFSISRI